jgi:hypothetical protein
LVDVAQIYHLTLAITRLNTHFDSGWLQANAECARWSCSCSKSGAKQAISKSSHEAHVVKSLWKYIYSSNLRD